MNISNIPDVGKVSTMQIHSINDEIRSTMSNIVENFFYIGEQLKYIKDNKLFKVSKYKNFIEYCKCEFGISKNQAYNFIAVYDRFSQDKYKRFSYSSLVEMLSLPQEFINEVGYETTVKEIREIKKKVATSVCKEETEVLEGQVFVEDILKTDVSQPVNFIDVKETKIDPVDYAEILVEDNIKNTKLKQQIKVIDESDNIKIESNEKQILTDFQIKLLNFFLDKYFMNFTVDYQDKFNNSKKLKALFGKENIDICIEMGEIKQLLEHFIKI